MADLSLAALRVAVRLRPLLQRDHDQHDGHGDAAEAAACAVAAHRRGTAADTQGPEVRLLSRSFAFDQVFDERSTQHEVFSSCALPLLM